MNPTLLSFAILKKSCCLFPSVRVVYIRMTPRFTFLSIARGSFPMAKLRKHEIYRWSLLPCICLTVSLGPVMFSII